MNYINIDIAIFVCFLALNLVVGLVAGRGVKTINQYALGNRNFSTGALVATIVAAWVSGSGFFITLSKTYSDGIGYLFASCSMALSLIISACFLIPRMGEFLGKVSVAEAMGDLYGKEVRIITGICGIIGNIGGIAVQFKVFGNVFNYFLGIESTAAIIIASTIAVTYSAFGGIRSVTYTDILQFFTYGFAIPIIGFLIWNHFHSLGLNYDAALNNPIFDYKTIFSLKNPQLVSMIFLTLYFACPTIDSMDFQRISMGKNIAQVKRAFLISAGLLILIKLAIAWIPFLIFSIDPGLKPNQLVSYIVNNYTHTGLKGLAIVGISAMALSTADSRMNASSVLFANDIGRSLGIKINSLLLSRIFTILLGVFSVYLALRGEDLLSIVRESASFYMPIVTVPLVLSILGFRSSKISVLIAMLAGFTTVMVWKILNLKEDCIIPAMFANIVFLFGSHYLLKQPGGWIKRQNSSAIKIDHIQNISNKIKNFNIFEFFKKYSPKSELTYMGFGVYCIFYTLTTIYSTEHKLFNSGSNILLYIYQIMLCTSVIMAMYPIWPPKIKHEVIVQVVWNFVVFYMLVLFSGFFALISGFNALQFVVFTINIIVITLLTSWRQALLMIVPGFYLSVKFYKYYAGLHDGLDVELGSPQYIAMYCLLLIGTVVVIFLRPKEYAYAIAQEKVDHLAERIQHREEELGKALELKNEFLCNISHEVRTPMVGITSLGPVLYEMYDKLEPEKVKSYLKDIADNSKRLESLMFNILDLSTLESLSAKLEYKLINLSQLVYERATTCCKLYLYGKDLDFTFVIEDNLFVSCDEYYIKQTIDNLIINAINYGKDSNITIALRAIRATANDNFSDIEFSIQDQGIGIPRDELHYIFGSFVVSSRTHTPAGGRGVGLALCKKVIDMHKGKIEAISDGLSGATFVFIIPR